MKILFSLIFLMTATSGLAAYKIAAYWGQNSAKPATGVKEDDLVKFCENYTYDVIMLAFNHMLFDSRNKDKLPGLSLSHHCDTPISSDYVSLLRCKKIEEEIKKCQDKGKKILLSIGGPTADWTLPSPGKAREYAHTIWELFLGGTSRKSLRPFGESTLDGINLDIEGGTLGHHGDFVREIRQLANTDGSRKYLITVSPQCPYPDHFVGPEEKGSLLEVAAKFVDALYVKFYNNFCATGEAFTNSLQKWIEYSKKFDKLLIFVEVPSAKKASSAENYYKTPDELKKIFEKLRREPRFGGFAIWDASYDQSNVINGKVYSEYISSILSQGPIAPAPTKAPEPDTNAPEPNTEQPEPTEPGSFSCEGKADGLYSHPTDCTKYFQCLEGKKYDMSCPQGLHFDKVKKICDWPQNANCNSNKEH